MENWCWIVLCCGMFASTAIAAPRSVPTGVPATLPRFRNSTHGTAGSSLRSTEAVQEIKLKPRRSKAGGDLFTSFKVNCPLRKVCRSARKSFPNAPLAEKLCAVGGKSVQWFRKMNKVNKKLSGKNKRIVQDGKRLSFLSLLESDSGKYVCTGPDANIELAVIRLSVKAVQKEVHFTDRPRQANLLQYGHSLELRCTASGYPAPTVFWLKHFKRVGTSGRVYASNDGTLHINEARHEDTAVYRCVADNRVHKHIVATSKVYVY